MPGHAPGIAMGKRCIAMGSRCVAMGKRCVLMGNRCIAMQNQAAEDSVQGLGCRQGLALPQADYGAGTEDAVALPAPALPRFSTATEACARRVSMVRAACSAASVAGRR